MSYEPDTPVLVAVLNTPLDWARIEAEHWYRIPVSRAPRQMAAEIVAWYQTKAFGEAGLCVRWYAPISRCRIMTRRELLPEEASHPRADERYWRFDLGPLAALPRPIRAASFRRVTFIPTRWERLLNASDVTELWLGDSAVFELCRALEHEGLSVTRRQLRDEPAYEVPAPARLWEVQVVQALDQIVVQWPGGVLRFYYAEVIWRPAACARQVQTTLGPENAG
jgi:hypothetical protein